MTLDFAIEVKRAYLASVRGCFDTARALLDVAHAIRIGASKEDILALSAYATLMSAKEREADIFIRSDFTREKWLRQSEMITKNRDEVIAKLQCK